MSAPVLVTGPSGNVGRPVVEQLLARGAAVRCGVLDPGGGGLPAGAHTIRLDFTDPSTFGPAVAGCRGLFLLRPPAISRVKQTLNRLVDVARDAGVGHVVLLSVAGAESNRLVPHHRVEQHLARAGVPHTILRPGFFADNLLSSYARDIEQGRLYVPAGDGRVAFVDARDLGEVAAIVLTDPDAHAGAAYHLTGPRAVTFSDVAAVLSARLGRPVRYEPASLLGYWRHLRGQGMVRVQVLVQTVLHAGLRRGDAEAVDPTLPRLLGRPSRTIEDYVRDHFAPAAASAGN